MKASLLLAMRLDLDGSVAREPAASRRVADSTDDSISHKQFLFFAAPRGRVLNKSASRLGCTETQAICIK